MCNLFQNDRAWSVGNFRVHFNAAVNGAWVHDGDIRAGIGKFAFCQSKQFEVFMFARQQCALHALVLKAQHDDDVDILYTFPQVMKYVGSQCFSVSRYQGFRGYNANFTGV